MTNKSKKQEAVCRHFVEALRNEDDMTIQALFQTRKNQIDWDSIKEAILDEFQMGHDDLFKKIIKPQRVSYFFDRSNMNVSLYSILEEGAKKCPQIFSDELLQYMHSQNKSSTFLLYSNDFVNKLMSEMLLRNKNDIFWFLVAAQSENLGSAFEIYHNHKDCKSETNKTDKTDRPALDFSLLHNPICMAAYMGNEEAFIYLLQQTNKQIRRNFSWARLYPCCQENIIFSDKTKPYIFDQIYKEVEDITSGPGKKSISSFMEKIYAHWPEETETLCLNLIAKNKYSVVERITPLMSDFKFLIKAIENNTYDGKKAKNHNASELMMRMENILIQLAIGTKETLNTNMKRKM